MSPKGGDIVTHPPQAALRWAEVRPWSGKLICGLIWRNGYGVPSSIFRNPAVKECEVNQDLAEETVIARTLRNSQVQIITNGEHAFVADEPARRGGDNLGPNPFSLILAALGS